MSMYYFKSKHAAACATQSADKIKTKEVTVQYQRHKLFYSSISSSN